MNPSKADSDANTLLATNQGTAVKSHSAVSTTSVQQWSDQRLVTGTDQLIEEVAVALVYNGISHVVMMVTPHELEAFALGFSLSEGILDLPEQLYGLDIHHQTQGIEIAMQISAECFEAGTPYLGTSAGSNICGLTINTTNDMPIVYPPSFKTLSLVPFNINPHYLDPDPLSKHMGETRETRIQEFHKFNTQPVVGLREGSYLQVSGENIILKGSLSARIFEFNKQPYELHTNSNLNQLK